MQYTVVIQPRRNGGFTASVPTLPGCRSQGTTEDEVIAKISAALAKRLKHSKVIQLEVNENGVTRKNPWDAMIGIFENDPIFDEVEKEIKRERNRDRYKRRKR
ncbi:MAG: type II toxin-antitoxin system HicB family antitoxin [bacterium]